MTLKYSDLFLRFVPLLFAGLTLSGCGGPPLPPGLPKLTSTILTLTQEGKPLDGATVTLYPVEPSKWYPTGLTDQSGKVELYTNGKYKGAPKGKYKIVITKIHTDTSKFGPSLEEGQPGYKEWLANVSKEKLNAYSVVDKKFADSETTTLEIEIPDKTGTFDLGQPVKDEVLTEE